MSERPRAVLLDTCAIIWLSRGELKAGTLDLLIHAGAADGVFVSPISAWEIGLLATSRAGATKVDFLPDPVRWWEKVMSQPMLRKAALTAAAAIEAARLPEPLHNDPGDRLLIATARELNIPIVTRDRKILDYASVGHVQAVDC